MEYSGAEGKWFMKKTRSKKSGDTVALMDSIFYLKKNVFQTKRSLMTRYIFFTTVSQAKLYETDQLGGKVESRSMTFGTDPVPWIYTSLQKDSDPTPAPDPGIFVSDLQDDN